MRKQLPILQDISVPLRGGADFTYSNDFPAICKNGYMETYKDALDSSQRLFFVKRPGTAVSTAIGPSSTPPGSNPVCVAASVDALGGQNVFLIYSDAGNPINTTSFYFNTTAKGAPGGWLPVASSYWHDILQLSANAQYGNYVWAYTNGVQGAVVDNTGASTLINDADYTAWTTKTNMIDMDGYIFQGDYSTGYIYNSDLNTPTSWTATGRIQAGIYPGKLVKLAKLRKYLVAFKTTSIEFFENTGNPTPGSPLSAVPDLARRYGLSRSDFAVPVSDGIIFAGFDPAGKPGIYKLNTDNLLVEDVGNDYLSQVLGDGVFTSSPNTASPAPTGFGTSGKASVLTFRNKELVILPLPTQTSTAVTTFVYDNKLKWWSVWSYNAWSEQPFPCNAIVKKVGVGNIPLILVTGTTADYKFYSVLETTYQDNGTTFEVKWISDKLDFGTSRRKYLNSFELLYDIGYNNSAIGPTTASVSFYYYDTDDGSSGTTPRTAVATGTGLGRLIFRRLGSFRSRRFVWKHSNNSPFRVGAMEVDYGAAEDDID